MTAKRKDAGSTNYKKALAFANRKTPDFTSALHHLQKALGEGSPHAAWALGTWYLHGHHVKKNKRHAVKLLKIAAAANIPEAHYDLGVSYETGDGTTQNYKRALFHYLASAIYGDAQGLRESGRFYWHGIGTEKNRKIARMMIEKSKTMGAKN